jgi:hypothetical protein
MERDFEVSEDLSLVSELVHVGNDDLRGYAGAVVRFWGLADTQPFAVADASY